MTIPDVDLLRCPLCGEGFEQLDGFLRCRGKHDFDIARRGYVNLSSPRAAKKSPDTEEMVDARERFLESDAYRPLHDRLGAMVSGALGALDAPGRNVIDVGCGPGFYLDRIVGHVRRGGGLVRGVAGIDLSKVAIRRARRRLQGGLFVVADAEEGLPFVDGAFGVALSVFAPRPIEELGRILRPGGRLVIAAAGPDHLIELRRELDLLGVHENKKEGLERQLTPGFEIEEVENVTFTLGLAAEQVGDLVAMGPNYWHRTGSALPPRAMRVTADFLLLSARPAGDVTTMGETRDHA